jgi:hypothetical protein
MNVIPDISEQQEQERQSNMPTSVERLMLEKAVFAVESKTSRIIVPFAEITAALDGILRSKVLMLEEMRGLRRRLVAYREGIGEVIRGNVSLDSDSVIPHLDALIAADDDAAAAMVAAMARLSVRMTAILEDDNGKTDAE